MAASLAYVPNISTINHHQVTSRLVVVGRCPVIERGARGYRHKPLQPRRDRPCLARMRALPNAPSTGRHGGIAVWHHVLEPASSQRHLLILARVDDTSCNAKGHAATQHQSRVGSCPCTWCFLHHAPVSGAGRCLDAVGMLLLLPSEARFHNRITEAGPDPSGQEIQEALYPGHQAGRNLPPSPAP